MQQLMSTPSPQSPVLAKDKIIQANKEIKDGGDKDSSDFLNLMLSQLKAGATNKTQKTEISIETIQIKSESLDSIKDLSIEEATFGQLLQFLEALHGKSNEPMQFLNISQKLKNILSKEGVLQEFKSAKNLQDIMDLSKKYNLGLEKLTVTSSEAKQLESIFPNLAKKGFFELKNSNLSSQEWLASKNKNATSVQNQSNKDEVPTLKDLLSGLDKGEKKSNTNENAKIQTKDEIKPETKSEVKGEVKPETKGEVKSEVKSEVKGEVKPETKGEMKSEVNSAKVDAKEQAKPTQMQEIRMENPKPTTLPPTSERDTATSNKENALKNLSELSQNSNQNNAQSESGNQEKGSESSLMNRESIKMAQQQLKTPQIKQTMNTFAQDFKEQVEQYKPPMMKIQMALNPKNLGEVEVTLVNRGNNLHVSFTSNTQTLSLFVQNQAEFKNSLVNMGFTNLEMNFSQKEEKGQDPRNSSGFNGDNEYEEELLEEEATLELTLPNYV